MKDNVSQVFLAKPDNTKIARINYNNFVAENGKKEDFSSVNTDAEKK